MKFLEKKKYRVMSSLSKYLFIIIIVFSFAMPAIVKADDVTCPDGVTKVATLDLCPPPTLSTKINNPLSPKIDNIPKLIAAILDIVLIVGVPIVALAIIYTGFLFVTAQGNEKKLATAKTAILFTLLGAVLLLGSWVIANAIGTTVDQIKNDQPK